MGVPRFSGGRQLNGGSMSFETYLNQINLLYPYAGDMYTKYLKLINEFDSNQMKRLIDVGEYETANSLFTSKLLVFAKLKENNVELFNSFVDAFEIREALEIIFDIGSMTLDEMLLFVSEQYPDDVATYEVAIQLIRDFELAEFMRFMDITTDDILADNETYNFFIVSLLDRLQSMTDVLELTTEDGVLISYMSEEQVQYVNERFSTHMYNFLLRQIQNDIPTTEQNPSTINFLTWYIRNATNVADSLGSFYSDIISEYEYNQLNYLELLSDATIENMVSIQYQMFWMFSNFQEMIISMKHLDERLDVNWDMYNVGIVPLIDSQLRTIADQLENNGHFVFTDAYSEEFKYVTEQSMYENIRLLEQADKLEPEHKAQVIETCGVLISQNLYGFSNYGIDKGYLGASVFGSFFMQLAGHFQGFDQWGIKGGMLCSSDITAHAQFICANISRLIQGHDSNTIDKMVGNTDLQYFFDTLYTKHPVAYAGIKSMMDNAKDLNA